jgi:hypothetical protein
MNASEDMNNIFLDTAIHYVDQGYCELLNADYNKASVLRILRSIDLISKFIEESDGVRSTGGKSGKDLGEKIEVVVDNKFTQALPPLMMSFLSSPAN